MHLTVFLLCFLVTITQHVSCFYNLCHSRKNIILDDDECSDLYFEPSEKETRLGHISLKLQGNSLNISSNEKLWDNAYLRISVYKNQTNKHCIKLFNSGAPNFCIQFNSEIKNETFLLEYKAEKLPEVNSRKFLFSFPQPESILFPYIDFTDSAHLIVKAQKLPTPINVSYYKVEAYKEKNNKTSLQDVRLFEYYEDISYEEFTYNDQGSYYFILSALSDYCYEQVCLQITTPTVYIGRRSTRLVIGIVGASFILPFVLFIFHILTKKYPIEENKLEGEIVVAYKSSFKKHNEVVVALAKLLEKLSKNRAIDVVDLSKSSKKFPDRFCIDALFIATRVIYVAPPINDLHTLTLDKAVSQKELFAVIFDYCSDDLPRFFHKNKIFKLFEDFDKFLHTLNISGTYESALFNDLRRKTEEAKIETDEYLRAENVPKIVITEEPQESDSLIPPNVVV